MSAWSDIWETIQEIAGITTGNQNLEAAGAGAPVVQDSAAAIQSATQAAGFFGFIEGLIEALTDPGMWISLGWLLLGLALIVAGVRMWMGKSPVPSPSVVPVPV